MKSSDKGSKEQKMLIKYKQQTCICSQSNHVELKLAYRPLSLPHLVLSCGCYFPLGAQNHEAHLPLIGFEFVYFLLLISETFPGLM